MKINNILRTFAVVFAALSLLSFSCSKEEPDAPGNGNGTGTGNNDDKEQEAAAPNFPKLVEDYNVAPGAELSLTFTPNYDWEVSVPTEVREWFWLKDGSFVKTELKGKASQSPVTVKLGVTENQDFDMSHSCEVTMKMNSKSQVIARYVLPAKERTIEIFAAEVENGAFVTDESGKYKYASVQASALSLIWSASDADFRMPVKIVSNSEWTVDIPSWMNVQIPESTTGVIEVVLTGASLSSADGEMVFKAGDSELKKLNVSVPACGDVAVYATQVDALGEFEFGTEGGYLYTESPVDAVTLIWPGSDFRMPVMVDAKCNWTLTLPEWLTVTYQDEEKENKAGQVKMTLIGNPKYYPLDDTTDKIQFFFNEEKIHEVSVTIPGVKDMFFFNLDMAMTSWEFNAAGELMTSVGYQADMPATGWFMGTKDATVVAVEMKDGKKVAENPDWIVMDIQAYVAGNDVLQQRTVSIKAKENTSTERSAYVIFCKSAYDSADYFNADGTLKEEMTEYAVSLVQHGSDIDYVTMLSAETEMTSGGVEFIESTNPRLVTYFGQTDYVYELTYHNQYASDYGYMSLAKPYASVKVYNAARKEQTGSDFWLSYASDSDQYTTGVIYMYKDMTPSESKTEGYVVFYDETGSTLAIIHCKYDPEVVVNEVVVEFTEESAQYAQMTGATLEHLTQGPIFDRFYEGMNTVYHLTYKMEGMPLKIKIPASIRKHNVNPYMYRTFFKVNNVVYDESFGPNDIQGEIVLDDKGAVEIYMNRPDSVVNVDGVELSENVYMANINFLDKSDGTVFVLVCTLDLSE